MNTFMQAFAYIYTQGRVLIAALRVEGARWGSSRWSALCTSTRSFYGEGRRYGRSASPQWDVLCQALCLSWSWIPSCVVSRRSFCPGAWAWRDRAQTTSRSRFAQAVARAVAELRLRLQPLKCNALLLAHGDAQAQAELLHAQVQEGAPEWGDFEAGPAASMLAFRSGGLL